MTTGRVARFERNMRYSGMLSCFFGGFSSFLLRSMASARISRRRVLRGNDDVVDEAARGRDERIGELGPVFLGALLDLAGVAEIAPEDDLDRALRAHDRDLGGRPRIVDVAAQVLRRHDVVGAAVRLARDQRDLGHGRLGEGEQQLGRA